jgi:WD40 repeat protein
MAGAEQRPRVFISFARGDSEHERAVRRLIEILSRNDAEVLWDAAAGPQLWHTWMTNAVRTANHILVIASPAYKRGAESTSAPEGRGKGVRWEAREIASKLYNLSDEDFLELVLPVVLPGNTASDFPEWLNTDTGMRTYYEISELSDEGTESILRHIFKRDQRTRGRPPEEAPVTRGIAAEFARALTTFEGRQPALSKIAAWLRDSSDRTSRIVTSGPGSGKTALLGLVAHLAGRYEHRVGDIVPREYRPPENSIDVALYVRSMVPGAILTNIAQAAGMPGAQIRGMGSARSLAEAHASLVGYLRDQQKQMTVLLDALDELSMPGEGEEQSSPSDLEDLCSELLSPLVADAESPIRFLLGGRAKVAPLAGFKPPGDDKVIDLDTEYQDDDALRRWVRRVLLGSDPREVGASGPRSPWLAAREADVKAAVDAIAGIAGRSFYVGEAVARTQARLKELPDPHSAQWLADLPRGAGQAMRNDLRARLPTATQAQRAIDLLLPLAYGRGDGVPWAEAWLPLANALRPKRAEAYEGSDLEWIRTHASSYVVEDRSAQTGLSLFRLYHPSLADYLREDERYQNGGHNRSADEHIIVQTLLNQVPGATVMGRDWARAPAYLRTYLLEHAVASGRLADIDELVFDPGFLAYGGDAELRAGLGRLTEAQHRAVADAYSSALSALLTRPSDADPQASAGSRTTGALRAFLAQLSLAASCQGADALAARIPLGTGPGLPSWGATWTAWRWQAPHIRLVGHAGRVRAITTAVLADRRVVAVTAGEDGDIRIWDVLRGSLVRVITHPHEGSVLELAAGTLDDGMTVVASTGDDRAARVWDLNTGHPVGKAARHHAPVHGLAVGELNHRVTIITGDDHGTVHVWDPVEGRETRRPYELNHSPVTALALIHLDSATHLVSARANGDLVAWSLAPTVPHVSTCNWHGTRAVRALAVGELERRPVVVSAGDDGAIYVWDPATDLRAQARRDPLAKHTGGVWSLAVATVDGNPAIVSAGNDGRARVWDLAHGAPIGAPFTGHDAPIRALAATEAGNRAIVISGGDDMIPRIWDLTVAGTANEPFTGHQSWIKSLLFTQINGRNRLISGSRDSTVRRWDPDTGSLMGRALEGHRRWVGALAAVDLAGRACILSAGADTQVRIWDASSGKLVGDPLEHPAGVTALLVTSVGPATRIVSGCLDGTALVWDPETAEKVASYHGHRGAVRALASVRRDPAEPGPFIVSAGDDGVLHVWDPATAKAVSAEPSGHPRVTALCEVPSHPSRVASGGEDGVIRVRDFAPSGGTEEWHRHTPSEVHALALTRSGESIAVVTTHADGTIRFSDSTDPQGVSPHRAHPGHARALAVGTAGARPAAFSGGDDALIRAWDLEHRTPLRTLHRGAVRSLAVTTAPAGDQPTGEWMVVSGGDDDTIQLRDLDGDRTRQERVLPGHHRGVRALAVSAAKPPLLISGGVDGQLKTWDLSTAKLLGRLGSHEDRGGHEGWVHALATGTLPGVGPVVVSASGDGQVSVWDLGHMTAIDSRKLHSHSVRAVSIADIAENGDPQPLIVSGSMDKRVLVSVLATGRRHGEPFTGHRSGVRALAATSLAGTPVVISGDGAGVVLAWDLKTRESVGDVPHGAGEVHAIAAQQRGYQGNGCTWVAVAAGESVTLSSWTAERSWEERARAYFGCEVLAVAMPEEYWEDEPPGRLVVAATQGVAVLRIVGPA